MKAQSNAFRNRALTLVDLLVLLACIVILAALLLPSNPRNGDSDVTACLRNLQEINLGISAWSRDHQDFYPWQTLATDDGSRGSSFSGRATLPFQLLSNYMSSGAATFACPSESTKRVTTNYVTLTEENISYFFNLNSTANNARSIVIGDRHVQVGGTPVKPGLLNLDTNQAIEWTRELHFLKKSKVTRGNIAFADGHVETVRENLRPFFQRQGIAADRLVFP